MNLKTTLKNIVNIQTGLFSRAVSQGEIVLLQAKHFDENGLMISHIHPELIRNAGTGRHLLRSGDILFAAKGTRNFAVVLDIGSRPCVASTLFFVLRIHVNFIIPAYLVWYLNHPNTLQLLKNQAKGTSIVSISKPVLEELEICVPDLKTQKIILEIARLRNREKLIKKQIEVLREKQIQHLILKAIK